MARISTDSITAEPNTSVIEQATANLSQSGVADRISTNIATLVKGKKVGTSEDAQAQLAERLFRDSIKKSHSAPAEVTKSLSAPFANSFGRANAPQQAWMENFSAQMSAQLGKSFTISGPGGGTSLVPYDLSAPAKLIYPVYSPFRNRIPRVQGMGVSHEAKILTNISGALPGGLGSIARLGISELGGGNINNPVQYPTGNLPAQGSQTSVDVNVPYKFFGLTEQVSWLAQFAGQGFDDAAGLASLILLQEMMLLEERAMIGACRNNLAAPAAPGVSARTAGTGEAALSGVTTNIYVRVTALTYYGESAPSAATTQAISAQVADVTIAPVQGALAYNVYVSTGASEPANGSRWLMVGSVGATKVTLQGALPTSGTNPPASDSGTGSANDYDGLISVISGHAAGGSNTGYPAGIQGSYVNQSVGDVLNITQVDNCLKGMWNGTAVGGTQAGILADPEDIWCEGSDATNLAHSIGTSGSTANFRWNIAQDESTGIRAGAAVSEYVNPITRKVMNIKVHPYIPQGTALFMSWQLPHPFSNVSNVWENVMVQDYLSVSWPVIDVTFKFSMFMYGTMFSPAPQYCGLLQGLQKSATTPYS